MILATVLSCTQIEIGELKRPEIESMETRAIITLHWSPENHSRRTNTPLFHSRDLDSDCLTRNVRFPDCITLYLGLQRGAAANG